MGNEVFIMPQIQDKSISSLSNEWRYLEKNPDSWRKQFFIKGRNIKASTIWLDMLLKGFTPEELADDRNLPIETIKEAIQYCQENQELLEQEALEECTELEKEWTLHYLSFRLLLGELKMSPKIIQKVLGFALIGFGLLLFPKTQIFSLVLGVIGIVLAFSPQGEK